MALDTRWKNPQSNSNENLYLWAQDLIKELRKGDYLDVVTPTDQAAGTLYGRATGAGTGPPSSLTGTQATAILDNFVGDSGAGGTKGLVPAPAPGDAAANKYLKASGAWAAVTSPGVVLLTSGSVSSAATLDLPLGAYTAYRTVKLHLYAWVPATDATALQVLFSTDNGSTWITTATYDYAAAGCFEPASFSTAIGSGAAAFIQLTGAAVGNASNEGLNCEIALLGWQGGTIWPRIFAHGYFLSSAATPGGNYFFGGGANETAQDCTGLRILFSSGNIASGNYALYGFA